LLARDAAVFPYVHVPPISFGWFSLDVQALLTLAGIVLGIILVHRRTSRLGIERSRVNSFLAWLLIGIMAGGHLFDVLCFRLEEIAEISGSHVVWKDPCELLRFWHGWRSVGGVFGAITATLLWSRYRVGWSPWFRVHGSVQVEGYRFVRRQRPEAIVGLADAVLFVFPLVWVLSRAGSALIHERPGMLAETGALFAVAYPRSTALVPDEFGVVYGSVLRYDLGLLELLATLPFAVGTLFFWKSTFRPGAVLCFASLLYPPTRFAIDFLARARGELAEPRLAGVTPTQLGCALIWMATLLALIRAVKSRLAAVTLA
jgi:prolipoprotein diacylglyceryltransferase